MSATATTTEPVTDPLLHLLPQSNGLRALHTVVRDRAVGRPDFVLHAGRIIRMLVESALDLLPHDERAVTTPTGRTYAGLARAGDVAGVSIARAGESMETELRAVCPGVPIGKILIQRDRVTRLPHTYYSLLPDDIARRHVLLLEPMLATGGTALAAIELLLAHGVAPADIVFVNVLASPGGIAAVRARHPDLTIVSSAVDRGLTEDAYMDPGIGDFGDRWFGTERAPAPAATS